VVVRSGFTLNKIQLAPDIIKKHGLKLTYLPRSPRVTKFFTTVYTQLLLNEHKPIYVPNQTIDNLINALNMRVLNISDDGKILPVLEGNPEIFRKRLMKNVGKLKSIIKSKYGYQKPYTPSEFISTYAGQPGKILRYTNAKVSLEKLSLRKQDSIVRLFLKKEKLNKQNPRVISPRDPRFLLSLGQFIKPIEHKVYKCLKKLRRFFRGDVVTKGLNALETAQLIAEKCHGIEDFVVIMFDCVKFDAHFRKHCIELENDIYNTFYTAAELIELSMMLDLCVYNICVAHFPDGRVRYKIVGGRMSGDVQTALGACTVMVLMLISLCDDKGIKKFDLFDNGDDAGLVISKKDLHKLTDVAAWFEQMGFRIKQEKPVYVIEEIEFCHSHPVEYLPGKWIMVRNFPDSIAKDTTCVSPINNLRELKAWFVAIGECGFSLTKNIPILCSFYQSMIKLGDGAKAKINFFADSGFAMMAKGVKLTGGVSDTARLSFAKAFQITPSMQILLEEYYKMMTYDLSNIRFKDNPGRLR
jgi:hypothetical protein